MNLFDENMTLGLECPQCGRAFEDTLGRLLREDYACPLCGVPLDTKEFRQVFGEENDTDGGTMDAGDMTKLICSVFNSENPGTDPPVPGGMGNQTGNTSSWKRNWGCFA